MLKVGLTGGFACGKSFVGAALKELGCYLIQADELGHEVLAATGEAYGEVVRQFGREIVDATGAIDRRRLAAQVFGDAERLAFLNAIVHPAVRRRQEAIIQEIASRDEKAIVIVEAAILIETGSYREFDRMIVVVCREQQQLDRAMHRQGLGREEAMARIARQMPAAEKRNYADYVIDTSGTKEKTLEQTRQVYESLRRLQA